MRWVCCDQNKRSSFRVCLLRASTPTLPPPPLLPLLCVCVNHYLPCLQLNGTSWQCGLCDAGGGGAAAKTRGWKRGWAGEASGGGRSREGGLKSDLWGSKDAEYVRLDFTGAQTNFCTSGLLITGNVWNEMSFLCPTPVEARFGKVLHNKRCVWV